VIQAIASNSSTMDKAFFALEDLKTQKKLDVFVFNIVLTGCAVGAVSYFCFFCLLNDRQAT